jgi:hypothetical protein
VGNSPLLNASNQEPFGLEDGSNLAGLISLNLNGTVLDRSTASANEPDLFRGFFNDGNWEVSRETVNDDDCLSATVGAFPSQHDAAQLPEGLRNLRRLLRAGWEVRQVYFNFTQISERFLFGVYFNPVFRLRHGAKFKFFFSSKRQPTTYAKKKGVKTASRTAKIG